VQSLIRLGLVMVVAVFLMGCGSEADGAYSDKPEDTKPTNSMAFTLSQLQDKQIYMTKGETTVLLIFHTSQYIIRSLGGFDLQTGSYTINADGSLVMGLNIYTRTAINSNQNWNVNESFDQNGDGVIDRVTPTQWYQGTQYALAFSIKELSGKSLRSTTDGITTVLSFTSTSYVRTLYNTQGVISSTSNTYNINNDGSVDLGQTNLLRIAKEGIVWTLKEYKDNEDANATVEAIDWYLDALTLSVNELKGKTFYTLDEPYHQQLSFNETSIMGKYYTLDGTKPLDGTYLIPYTINNQGSIVTESITYSRINITDTYWSMKVSKDTNNDGIADNTQTQLWYLNKPISD